MAKKRVVVIGTGSIGEVHLRGYAANPEIEIAGICDVNPERLRAMGRAFSVAEESQFADYHVMLDRVPADAASVCLPNALHCEAAEATLRRGLHTLLEKPIAVSQPQADRIVAAASASAGRVMVAFSHRFIAINQMARKKLVEGAIGKPYMIRVRYSHNGPYPGWAQGDWFYRKALAGGGALLDMGIHAIDICRYFVGEISSVSALVGTLRKPIEVDDCAVLQLEFAGGACYGMIECGWTSPAGFMGIEIFGDAGAMVLDLVAGGRIIRGGKRPDGTHHVEEESLDDSGMLSHWPAQMHAWTTFLATGDTPDGGLPGLEDGVRSLAVALAAEESSASGKRVALVV